jgi:hypothetical protein
LTTSQSFTFATTTEAIIASVNLLTLPFTPGRTETTVNGTDYNFNTNATLAPGTYGDIKSILDNRPIFHKRDETIRGHVFCSFLALVLRKELDRRLEKANHCLEWVDIKQDLKALQEIILEDNEKTLAVRSECQGTCGKVFKSVGIAIPPTIREIS